MRKLKSWMSVLAVLFLIFAGLPVFGAEDAQQININTASIDELKTLSGIGEIKARRIIDFRENNGLFKQPEDLIQVPSIGPKTFEANKDRIVVK